MCKLVLTIVVLVSINTAECNEYCSIKCGSHQHTVCDQGMPCPVQCADGTKFSYLTDDQRESILDLHNTLRNKLAAGLEKRGGFGEVVSNMKVLSWSKEAEFISACRTKTCQFKHDKCRSLLDGTSCGQNIHSKGTTGQGLQSSYANDPHVFNSSIMSWYDEVKDCGCNIKNYEGGKSTGHYTQVIWATSQFIGCSKITYSDGQWTKGLLYCNYCPAGNVLGMPIYVGGQMGTDCGKDPRYSHLCGKQRRLADDPFELHGNLVVWATSQFVGCSKIRYNEGNWTKGLLFCNYFPAGNVRNMSKMSRDYSKDQRYSHLCGKQKPLEHDFYESHGNLVEKPTYSSM